MIIAIILHAQLWRHGDRAPAAFAATDPYQSPDNWPVGLGQLTPRGMRQHYALGQWLRRRYDGWLPLRYSENDIYIRSTDYDRTLDSAYANLAALYPPAGGQIWNENLLWQPIPVHTMPGSVDYALGADLSFCPRYLRLSAELMDSPEIVQFVRQHQDILDYIANNTNSHPVGVYDQIMDALMVRDTLFIEQIYDMPLPAWTQRIYPNERLDELAMLFYVLPAYTTELATLRVGYWLKEVLDRSSAKVAGTLQPDRKVWAYSAHDLNISTVLYALGLFDGEFVQYAATLLFEVRVKEDGQAYLSIAYRRTAEDRHAEALFIPGCGQQCLLSRVYELYADILPTEDFWTACSK